MQMGFQERFPKNLAALFQVANFGRGSAYFEDFKMTASGVGTCNNLPLHTGSIS